MDVRDIASPIEMRYSLDRSGSRRSGDVRGVEATLPRAVRERSTFVTAAFTVTHNNSQNPVNFDDLGRETGITPASE